MCSFAAPGRVDDGGHVEAGELGQLAPRHVGDPGAMGLPAEEERGGSRVPRRQIACSWRGEGNERSRDEVTRRHALAVAPPSHNIDCRGPDWDKVRSLKTKMRQNETAIRKRVAELGTCPCCVFGRAFVMKVGCYGIVSRRAFHSPFRVKRAWHVPFAPFFGGV